MNMKKLLACVVGSAVLMSNVAFAAVTTTTTYNATTGKVAVNTRVSELENGSMVTYVLYGEKDKDTTPFAEADGSITATEATTPDENNILYIDQNNNVTGGTAEFTAPGLNVGEAYGAKVIVGTDTASDESDVAVTEEYTGDMYTLKLDANAVDYTAKVEVNMGTKYIKEYTLEAGASVKVPVGAECQVKVTFEAANGKAISKAFVAGTEITNAANLNNSLYAEGQEYILSAEVEDEVAAPLITVSDPIVGTNQVSYLVNVENFANVLDTGLKIEFNGHVFDNLSPIEVAAASNCYAIRILDETDDGALGMPNVTNDYTVTAFIKVNDVNIYAGSISAEDPNHFTVNTDSTLGDGAEDSTEGIVEEEPDVEEQASDEIVEEEPAAEEPAGEEN